MPTDLVMPQRNEIEMMAMAINLGYDTLVMAYSRPPPTRIDPPSGLTVFIASLDNPTPWATLCLAKAKEDSRGLFEQGSVDGVFRFETTYYKDFMHQRGSGLNAVLADIAARKKKMVILDFSQLLHFDGEKRGAIMGRMSQNIRVLRKSKPPVVIASLATTPYMMRSPHDLQAIFCVLGMHPAEAKDAMEAMKDRAIILKETKQGRAIGTIARRADGP